MSGYPSDRITLKGLRVKGFHGVYEHERRDGQDFVVDVVLHLDTHAAGASDDLADTVDYGALAVALAEEVRGEPVNLLERLAERLAARCLTDPRVGRVDVTVHKPSAPIPEAFGDVAVTVRRARPRGAAHPGEVDVVLALGANLGDREATLQSAVDALAATPGPRVLAASPVVETAPVGGPEQPDYLNAVLTCRTTLGPGELLSACLAIENEHGRVRETHWGARTLDIDVITYGELELSGPDLELPHPRAAARAFVLLPWSLLDPDARLAGRDVAALAEAADDRDGVRCLKDVRLVVPKRGGGGRG